MQAMTVHWRLGNTFGIVGISIFFLLLIDDTLDYFMHIRVCDHVSVSFVLRGMNGVERLGRDRKVLERRCSLELYFTHRKQSREYFGLICFA